MGGQLVDAPSEGRHAVWTSGTNFACNLEKLKEHGIGAVVTCGNIDFQYPENIRQVKLFFEDKPEEDVIAQVEKAQQFIDEARKNTGVVIHCVSGISRGPAITIGYLMKANKLSYEQALELVKGKRECTHPNAGFESQLKAMK